MTLLLKLANYLTWANDVIWDNVNELSDEEYNRTLYETGGSIHLRYVHLARDTWEWFHDWLGEMNEEPDFSGMSRNELFAFVSKYVKKWIGLIDYRSVDEYQDERSGKVITVKFDEMFFHLVNHFTYHRGQIVMSLRMLGKEVPMTDYIPFRFSLE